MTGVVACRNTVIAMLVPGASMGSVSVGRHAALGRFRRERSHSGNSSGNSSEGAGIRVRAVSDDEGTRGENRGGAGEGIGKGIGEGIGEGGLVQNPYYRPTGMGCTGVKERSPYDDRAASPPSLSTTALVVVDGSRQEHTTASSSTASSNFSGREDREDREDRDDRDDREDREDRGVWDDRLNSLHSDDIQEYLYRVQGLGKLDSYAPESKHHDSTTLSSNDINDTGTRTRRNVPTTTRRATTTRAFGTERAPTLSLELTKHVQRVARVDTPRKVRNNLLNISTYLSTPLDTLLLLVSTYKQPSNTRWWT